jgi:anti-sigma-K factor RskA
MTLPNETLSLAGEYVLGLVEGLAHEEALKRLRDDADFARAMHGWEQDFAAFDRSAPLLEPSSALWSRIQDSCVQESSAQERRFARPAGLEAGPRWWNALGFWRPFGLSGALASLVLTALLVFKPASGPALPQLVAVLNAPDGRASAIVNAYADGTVQLVPLDDLAVPQGRILEVWTLQDRARGPVSTARMDKARTIKLNLKGLSAAQVGHLFEITLEPEGGSPTGRPTGPVLMKGLAALRL